MKNKKFKLLNILPILFPLAVTVMSLVGVVFAAASALTISSIEKQHYFEYTYEGHKFKCYNCVTDNPEEYSAAIEWSVQESNTYPSGTLNLPETVRDSETGRDYTVRAICDGGFRYCPSTAINVPNTVISIGKEAFAYCEKITEFVFPYGVTKIEPSTFLDCHKLKTVVYRNSTGGRTLTNSTITEIGDHAFDSCKSLTNFYCPSSVVTFRKSCFQRCTALSAFYFPSEYDDHSNLITVESYAFADCPDLALIYFEENMHTVNHHAFTGANSSCYIDYTGQTEPSYDTHWRDFYISTNNTSEIPIRTKQDIRRQDNNYPGLIYSIQSGPIKLNWGKSTTPIQYAQSGEYAVIKGFQPPFETIANYWNHTTGKLELPDELDGRPVKIIKEEAFATNQYIKQLYLNPSLVQIQRKAFYKCTEMSVLDFSRCTGLKEIGCSLFFTMTERNSMVNDKIDSLLIPNTVEYIGDYAFFNLTNITNCLQFGNGTGLDCALKVIGDRAFSISQNRWENIKHNGTALKNITTATIDLVIPCSISDQAEEYAQLDRSMHTDYNYNKKTYARHYGIGAYAFACQYALKSAKMAMCDHAAHDDNGSTIFTTSLAQNVFNRSQNIVYFISNKNLCYIGPDTFKGVTRLKEVFLDSTKAEAHSTHQHPWGLEDFSNNYNNTLFSAQDANTLRSDLVIYVTGPKAPKSLDTNPQTGDKKYPWNVENNGEFKSDLSYDEGYDSAAFAKQIRRTVPTFYNVDFTNPDDVLYWNPSTSSFETNRPSSLSDYKKGLISIVKVGTKYTVAKYYVGSGHEVDEIDLTGITYNSTDISSNITTIGSTAFAADSSDETKNHGKYFILPSSVTKIEERAFMRLNTSNASNGARIVTFKDNGTVKVPTGSGTTTYANYKSACEGSGSAAGYCVLPTNLEYLGRNAFYNNKFAKVDINSSIGFIGNGAFYVHTNDSNVSKLTTFNFSGNSAFSVGTDGGLYFTKTGSNKVLMHMPAGTSGATLTLDSGTKAIGYAALAHTNYGKITLPTGCTTIYGSGFANNTVLTEVDGALSSLKYISGVVRSGDTEVYNSSTDSSYYDIIDFRNFPNSTNYEYYESNHSAFRKCTALTTFDFTSLTNIKKIGRGAFKGCSALSNCANGATYKFYEVNHTGGNTSGGETTLKTPTTKTSGVLDLSNCTQLEVLSYQAFSGCSAISHIVLPNSRGNLTSESKLYVGFDPDAPSFGNTFKGHFCETSVTLLFGESIKQADTALNQLHSPNHYHTNLLQISKRYYRADSIADLDEDSDVDRYWTLDGDKYILFGHWYEAHDYFAAQA